MHIGGYVAALLPIVYGPVWQGAFRSNLIYHIVSKLVRLASQPESEVQSINHQLRYEANDVLCRSGPLT